MGAAPLVGHKLAAAQTRDEGKAMQKRPLPLSGEALPVIGCGTYVGFDVGADPEKLKAPLSCEQATKMMGAATCLHADNATRQFCDQVDERIPPDPPT
jgi:hypothetical protein